MAETTQWAQTLPCIPGEQRLIISSLWTSKPFTSNSILSLNVEVAGMPRVQQDGVNKRSREVTAPGRVWSDADLTSEPRFCSHRKACPAVLRALLNVQIGKGS